MRTVTPILSTAQANLNRLRRRHDRGDERFNTRDTEMETRLAAPDQLGCPSAVARDEDALAILDKFEKSGELGFTSWLDRGIQPMLPARENLACGTDY
jgi:hypothetical protein